MQVSPLHLSLEGRGCLAVAVTKGDERRRAGKGGFV